MPKIFGISESLGDGDQHFGIICGEGEVSATIEGNFPATASA